MSESLKPMSGPDGEGLLAAFRAVRDALLSGDVEAIRELYDQDFRSHSIRGDVEGRQAVLEAYGPGGVRLDMFEVEDLAVEIFGDVGLLTGLGSISGRYDATEFRHRVRFVDIYVWRDGRWRFRFSQSTEVASDSP
ncbi:MAG: nuclear transport factor 2 family protein [Comamonadaceae bacterium]|nr:nuclear transport factor 2 family protein [Comamonadaceae bacterium]